MKKFIKENLVLVLGLTLPLLLIVLFFFAAILPKWLGEPPQYEMLFARTHYQSGDDPQHILRFSVEGEQVMVVSKIKVDKNGHARDRTQKLFAYDGKSERVREIAVDDSALVEGVVVAVAGISNMVVDASTTSPDGYVLDKGRYGGRGLVNGLFGGSSRSHYRLVKGNISYKLPRDERSYYYNQLIFLGWVVKE